MLMDTDKYPTQGFEGTYGTLHCLKYPCSSHLDYMGKPEPEQPEECLRHSLDYISQNLPRFHGLPGGREME